MGARERLQKSAWPFELDKLAILGNSSEAARQSNRKVMATVTSAAKQFAEVALLPDSASLAIFAEAIDEEVVVPNILNILALRNFIIPSSTKRRHFSAHSPSMISRLLYQNFAKLLTTSSARATSYFRDLKKAKRNLSSSLGYLSIFPDARDSCI